LRFRRRPVNLPTGHPFQRVATPRFCPMTLRGEFSWEILMLLTLKCLCLSGLTTFLGLSLGGCSFGRIGSWFLDNIVVPILGKTP
jgi:hypothetical protein